MDVKNRNVIITGGSIGYGKGIAQIFRKAGANVWITGRNIAKLQQTATEIDTSFIQADVSIPEDWDKVFQTVGQVDILINNAGAGGKIQPLAQQSDCDIITTINANLTGAILGASRAAKSMIPRRSGMIINISSVCALYAWPSWSVYTAAKAGLSKFSHALYTELRPYGIRVMCVTPSWGKTQFNESAEIPAALSPEIMAKSIDPLEIGKMILDIVLLPDHLAVVDVTLQPMIQEIVPM